MSSIKKYPIDHKYNRCFMDYQLTPSDIKLSIFYRQTKCSTDAIFSFTGTPALSNLSSYSWSFSFMEKFIQHGLKNNTLTIYWINLSHIAVNLIHYISRHSYTLRIAVGVISCDKTCFYLILFFHICMIKPFVSNKLLVSKFHYDQCHIQCALSTCIPSFQLIQPRYLPLW